MFFSFLLFSCRSLCVSNAVLRTLIPKNPSEFPIRRTVTQIPFYHLFSERSVSASISSSSVELSVTSGSDLSISLTESELAEVSEGGPHHPDVPPTRRTEGSSGLAEKSSLPMESEHHSTSLHSLESLHTADRKTRPQSSSGSTSQKRR